MARLYRYADSNKKSGYYIIGDSGNATFQVEPVAQSLFKELGYHPPVKTEQQGPRVPSKLQWLLFDIGWIFTGETDAGSLEHREVSSQLESAEVLTDEMTNEIRKFVEERRGKDVQELATRLDLDITYERQERLATLDEEKYEPLEEYVWGYMEAVLTQIEEESIEAIDVTVLDLSDRDNPRSSLNVIVQTVKTEPNFRHTITSSVEEGISVVSATGDSQTWGERGRMNRHRGHLFGALEAVSKEPNMDIEFNESEISDDVEYITTFSQGIALPDEIKNV